MPALEDVPPCPVCGSADLHDMGVFGYKLADVAKTPRWGRITHCEACGTMRFHDEPLPPEWPEEFADDPGTQSRDP